MEKRVTQTKRDVNVGRGRTCKEASHHAVARSNLCTLVRGINLRDMSSLPVVVTIVFRCPFVLGRSVRNIVVLINCVQTHNDVPTDVLRQLCVLDNCNSP